MLIVLQVVATKTCHYSARLIQLIIVTVCQTLNDLSVSQLVSHKGSKFLKKLWCYVGGRV